MGCNCNNIKSADHWVMGTDRADIAGVLYVPMLNAYLPSDKLPVDVVTTNNGMRDRQGPVGVQADDRRAVPAGVPQPVQPLQGPEGPHLQRIWLGDCEDPVPAPVGGDEASRVQPLWPELPNQQPPLASGIREAPDLQRASPSGHEAPPRQPVDRESCRRAPIHRQGPEAAALRQAVCSDAVPPGPLPRHERSCARPVHLHQELAAGPSADACVGSTPCQLPGQQQPVAGPREQRITARAEHADALPVASQDLEALARAGVPNPNGPICRAAETLRALPVGGQAREPQVLRRCAADSFTAFEVIEPQVRVNARNNGHLALHPHEHNRQFR
mmetsp:Transcript_26579/g.76578  ORF Transcript_26579/g.76578 Transcript_26579/m.76578 type:complete len:330 (+) Transcript_26579:143-1132(+)